MKKISYYLLWFFTGIFILVPFRLLYMFSDFIYIIFYYVIGYRKKVVFRNLRKSFPEKTEDELKTIAKGFYHHLCDVFLESLKAFTISEEEVVRRYKLINSEFLDQLYEQKRSVIAVAGHFGNWEWGGMAAGAQMKHLPVGFYKPFSNPYTDAFVRKRRVKGRSILVSITDTQAVFKKYSDQTSAYYMIADQSPSSTRLAYWVQFMNQDTAVLHGPEKYARHYNYPVVYVDIQKVKRGYYTFEFILLSDQPATTQPAEITTRFVNILEEKIRKKPQFYLWSHRRWKLKRVTESPSDRVTK